MHLLNQITVYGETRVTGLKKTTLVKLSYKLLILTYLLRMTWFIRKATSCIDLASIFLAKSIPKTDCFFIGFYHMMISVELGILSPAKMNLETLC